MGRGKKSSHGWCGIVRWILVGWRLRGRLLKSLGVFVLVLAGTGAGREKRDRASSSRLSSDPPTSFRFCPNARKTLTFVRVRRWSDVGSPIT